MNTLIEDLKSNDIEQVYIKIAEDYRSLFENILTKYYEGGQWLKDYECDERGELPGNLKRGILSEDGFYNFLVKFEEKILSK